METLNSDEISSKINNKPVAFQKAHLILQFDDHHRDRTKKKKNPPETAAAFVVLWGEPNIS